MDSALTILKSNSKSILFDIIAITSIYFLPIISHDLSIPLYYLEPMRIALLLSIIYTNKMNTYIIGISLPIFSFIVSAHPVLIKSLLISTELLLNILIFFELKKYVKNVGIAIGLSIGLSKLFYYLIKYLLISSSFLSMGLISTPIYLQITLVVLFSAIFNWLYLKRSS